ncbi:MAG TPA: ATP-binding protein [Anaerolineae bacterium]|nr:ATP-binding protein [Anaerolineae bacterium]
MTAALAVIRAALQRPDSSHSPAQLETARRAWEEAARAMPSSPALETLCTTFGLSPFERDILLLCAGMELDATFAALCANAQGDPQHSYPTFSLALATLPEAHWSALPPNAPLRHWRLIEVAVSSTLTQSPLRIDERILHYLTGLQHLDERLIGLVEIIRDSADLMPSQRVLVDRISALWSQSSHAASLPIVQLCGSEAATQRAIASAVCAALGLNLGMMSANAIPLPLTELEGLIRLWEREAALSNSALLLDCGDLDVGDHARQSSVTRLMERLHCPLLVASRERRHVPGGQHLAITFDVDRPTTGEQRTIWQNALGASASALNGQIEALVSQFNLNTQTIRATCVEALGRSPAEDLGWTLWNVARVHSRPRLNDLAQRIEPIATWEELVLPEPQQRLLHEIAAHVRQRLRVYEAWGFSAKSARGLGISALFAGASGTGKTMAAEVLAKSLRLDLYRIDLSQVVNKYIGETEKNLRRVFDAAEEGGAILLFDEADALFGKRSDVKDSHDRYANIEISYLLQRMESYRGLAILTTNMKDALDSAFMRRIRFVVQFPFPDTSQRAEIWRRIFPQATPTEDLDVGQLARLNVPGGNIRNIALNAAFLAADANEPVRMAHLLRAARVEYAKMEKPLTEAEIRGWA